MTHSNNPGGKHNNKSTVRVDRCLCGHLQLSIGHTSIALDVEAARVISELLAQAVYSSHQDGVSKPQNFTDELH